LAESRKRIDRKPGQQIQDIFNLRFSGKSVGGVQIGGKSKGTGGLGEEMCKPPKWGLGKEKINVGRKKKPVKEHPLWRH